MRKGPSSFKFAIPQRETITKDGKRVPAQPWPRRVTKKERMS